MKIKCPSCNFENIEGTDRCEQCLYTLMQRDLPRPKKDDILQMAFMVAPVSSLLTGEDLLVASSTDPISRVISIMKKKKKDCVLIYQKKKLVGILSQRTLLNEVAGKYEDLSKVKVQDIMTPNPEFVKAEDPIAAAVNKMSLGGFRHLPVLAADGAPLSIISIKDVLAYLVERTEIRDKKA